MDQEATTATGGVPVAVEPLGDHLFLLYQAAHTAGLDLERAMLVLLACALCFFVGVAVRCIHCWGTGLRVPRLLAMSVPTFFLTSPVQAVSLTNNWGDSPLTPFDWLAEILRNGGSVQVMMFAFGLTMMLGFMVEPIFSRIARLVETRLKGTTAPS